MSKKILDVLLGRKQATKEVSEQTIGVFRGVPTLGLDALASAAYGPEAALTIMLGLGMIATRYVVPVFVVILALLAVLFFSYLQTISAYPNGGGAYTVAGENLGERAGLFAAASLLLDYVLDVAVGISAGVGALVSAIPELRAYTMWICLAILGLIVLINLRGVRNPGTAFAPPTYLFVATLFIVIGVGVARAIVSHGHPLPVMSIPRQGQAVEALSRWLLIRAFASGCTAMTGVEAVSNGVTVFKDPKEVHARRTLTLIVAILAVLLIGVVYLCRAYQIGATIPDRPGYDSVLSQIVEAVFGRGWFYYVTVASILAVLCLSANTAFADFPRLCQLLGKDGHLPHAFADLGRRLVFTVGIVVLTALSALLIIIFGGITDRLIPLFAIGAFLAFTFSQAGMVVHWQRNKARHARISQAINAVGCVATGISVVIIFAAKFAEGAWITLIIIGIFYYLFVRIKGHYNMLFNELKFDQGINLRELKRPVVAVTVGQWSNVAKDALQFALEMSNDVHVLHVSADEETTHRLREDWSRFVVEPMASRGKHVPPLTVVSSPFREIREPLLKFVNHLKHVHPNRPVAVVVPELVSPHWYAPLLHRQWGTHLKRALLEDGEDGVVVVSVPWRVKK